MKLDQNAVLTPKRIPTERFRDAEAALARLELIYDTHTAFLRDQFEKLLKNGHAARRASGRPIPEVLIETSTYAQIDSRLVLRPCRRARGLLDHGDAARALPRLPPRAAPPAPPQPRRAGRDRPVDRADPAPFRLSRRHPRRGRDHRPDGAAASRPLRRARPRGDGRRHRQRHLPAARPARRCRLLRSRRRASTIRSTACRTTRRRRRSISRTS